MVLVRDKKGHLFGGYAAEGWSKHGHFYGSALSFIFSLAPAVARFRASGANENMLWCGQGFSQLPNGIGWGGKVCEPNADAWLAMHLRHCAVFMY